jgi:tetratricopeptide (TPR) repeat protein
MHITLAEAYIAQNNYDDAIDTLSKAQSLENRYNEALEREGSSPVRNVKTQVLKAQCLCKQKNFNEALDAIDEVISYTRSAHLGKIEHAFSLIDKAAILAEIGSKDKIQKAIECQEEGISTASTIQTCSSTKTTPNLKR